MTGYVNCAHTYCCAIIIGRPGDLCDDCLEHDPDPQAGDCLGCDNDSDIEVQRCKRCDSIYKSSVKFPEDYPPHSCPQSRG